MQNQEQESERGADRPDELPSSSGTSRGSMAELLDGSSFANSPLRIAPTDLATYVRLDQCERFLRLQLFTRNSGDGFLKEYDVAPQSLPSLLTGSGATFEHEIVEQLRGQMPVRDCSPAAKKNGSRTPDNSLICEALRGLDAGERIALVQPRLVTNVGDWAMRGDIDLLLMERNDAGVARVLVIDMKSSVTSRVEHRLQVACYLVMLRELFIQRGLAVASIDIGIVYRGADDPIRLSPEEQLIEAQRRLAATDRLGISGACLDLIADPTPYLDVVDDLALARHSTARRAIERPFDETSFELTSACDGCLYNEFCLKRTREQDDLSMLPHISVAAKRALQAVGITKTFELARLEEPAIRTIAGVTRKIMAPVAGKEAVCQELSANRAIGGRLEELVSRARRYQSSLGERFVVGNDIRGAGYGSLPFSDAEHDPNLVRIYLDVQRDYLHDRLYLVSALVQGCTDGEPTEAQRHVVLELSEQAPDSAEIERDLLLRFIGGVFRAVVAAAAPNPEGEQKIPLHLIFFNRAGLTHLLKALARHEEAILGAAPLYDLLTQLPAFDSPMVTALQDEIRTLKNYPILAQSLYAVSRFLRFDWNQDAPLTDLFSSRVFDDVRPAPVNEDETPLWYTGRSRFSSDVPLEYAYHSWGLLAAPTPGSPDERATYRQVGRDEMLTFARRRLDAIEHIANDFKGNQRTYKSAFDLDELALLDGKARTLADAIAEFIVIERHVALTAWKSARQDAPERRMLDGTTLVLRYLEEDQETGVAEQNCEHKSKQALYEAYAAAFREENPEEPKVILSKEQKAETNWNHTGMRFRFRIETDAQPGTLEQILAIVDLREGNRVVIGERWSVDSRLPEVDRVKFQTTAKQLLYGDRADIEAIERIVDNEGSLTGAIVTLKMAFHFGGEPGFVFFGRRQIFEHDELYTIDDDPNDIMLSRGLKATKALQEGALNAVIERMEGAEIDIQWNDEAIVAQARFWEGLDAFISAGLIHSFEYQKQRYIGLLGDAPTILVQGPPGTGKSYTTAFAVWARMQGALAAGLPLRVSLTCKTHAATDVLLRNVADVQRDLNRLRQREPELFYRYFDDRILAVPCFRFEGSESPPQGVTTLWRKGHPSADKRTAADLLMERAHVVLAATPGGIWRIVADRWPKDFWAKRFLNLAVLDEASQMGLPEAIMATIPLDIDGQLIVVGDHRQMPPIVQHDWANEARRTFKEYAAFESLYLALDRKVPEEHKIKFAESFRLHKDMAEFLRREIYHQDGIPYFSKKMATLQFDREESDFARAVLGPEPLTIVLHDEAASQSSNIFEEAIVRDLLETLGDDADARFDPGRGIGVVVPHRAQRAALQASVPLLTVRDPITGAILRSSVDTVERFQGDEREVILVSLTESDPQFIRSTSDFLLDPRRLTVALSRAKQKMIVVASRTVFTLFSADEEGFENAALWKNFLRRTCTNLRWSGDRDGIPVEVWVNPPLEREE